MIERLKEVAHYAKNKIEVERQKRLEAEILAERDESPYREYEEGEDTEIVLFNYEQRPKTTR